MTATDSAPLPSPELSPQRGTDPLRDELHGYALRLLECCGGLVDWAAPDTDGTALLPNEVAARLRLPEVVRISARPEPGGLNVSLASEFLDQSGEMLQWQVPRLGAFELPEAYLKRGDLQAAIDKHFTWHNVRVRVGKSTAVTVDYHAWWFFAALKSEDAWETRLPVTINAASQAPVELPDLLSSPDLLPTDEAQRLDPATTFDAARRIARAQMLATASPFLSRLESRLERDRKRLRDYYAALGRESKAGARRKTATAEPTAEELAARKEVVRLELQRKLSELQERYEIDARLDPITCVGVRIPVLKVELRVQRRQALRTHDLYWNPLLKQFEPLACSACGQGTVSAAFTDDEVAPLCVQCYHE